MTVSDATRIDTGTAGTGAEQTISFTIDSGADTEIKVKIQDATAGTITELVKDTDYTVTLTGSGVPNHPSGSITTLTPFVASTFNIYIYRVTTATQSYDPINNDDMDAETLEQAIDKLFMLVADLQETVSRCIKIPLPDNGTVEVANYIDRASTTLGFDSNGDVTTT